MSQEQTDTGTGIKVYTEKSEGIVSNLVRAPRILLLLLAAWTLLGVVVQMFSASPLFLDNHDQEMDGALGGFAFTWPGIALAAVYIYCAREPDRYPKVFWLALIQMGTAVVAQLYHWLATDDFSFESIIVPLAGSAAAFALVFLYVAQDRDALLAAEATGTNPEKR